jgi:hypothetical protein
MGTTTFFLRHNDMGLGFKNMKKADLKELDELSPWGGDKSHYRGWRVEMELHNGNIDLLVWWKGRLMRLEDAPRLLDDKFYNKYTGKRENIYEWTLLKRSIERDLDCLDKEFKRHIRKKRGETQSV